MDKQTTLFVLLFLFCGSCSGLKCYYCNSDNDDGTSKCADVTTQVVKDCQHIPNPFQRLKKQNDSGEDWRCIKIKGQDVHRDGSLKIVRLCLNIFHYGLRGYQETCDRGGYHQIARNLLEEYNVVVDNGSRICYCSSDGCNGPQSKFITNHGNTCHSSRSSSLIAISLFFCLMLKIKF